MVFVVSPKGVPRKKRPLDSKLDASSSGAKTCGCLVHNNRLLSWQVEESTCWVLLSALLSS